MKKINGIIGILTIILWMIYLFTHNQIFSIPVGLGIGWMSGIVIGYMIF